jgi:hypothetical protein
MRTRLGQTAVTLCEGLPSAADARQRAAHRLAEQ